MILIWVAGLISCLIASVFFLLNIFFPGSLRSKTYRFYANFVQFEEAKRECIHFGGRLAIIKNQEVNEFLQRSISSAISPIRRLICSFIGMTGQDTQNWVYLDGTNTRVPLKSDANGGFQRWGRTEPNDVFGNEDCGCIDRYGFWYDTNCFGRRPFICEKGKNLTTDKKRVFKMILINDSNTI